MLKNDTLLNRLLFLGSAILVGVLLWLFTEWMGW